MKITPDGSGSDFCTFFFSLHPDALLALMKPSFAHFSRAADFETHSQFQLDAGFHGLRDP